MTRSVITIIRDSRNSLGKRFRVDKTGEVKREPGVLVSEATAIMRQVDTVDDMADLLREVGNDPHAAIVPDVFDGIAVGEEFVVLSEKELKRRLGKDMRRDVVGVHLLEVNGKQTKVVGRLKENIKPGAWRLLDRDVDEFTPPEFAAMGFDAWLQAVGRLLPGVEFTSFVRAESTSKRVLQGGKPVSTGNAHVWVKLENPDDSERTRQALVVRAIDAGLHWLKPRFSRTTGERISAGQPTTIIDPSVWTVGRLVFVGKPVVCSKLKVSDPSVEAVHGMEATLWTEHAEMPDADRVREITKSAGCELVMSRDGDTVKFSAYDLALDTVLETVSGSVTVEDAMRTGKPLRCQTPFRESDSMAAKLNFSGDGRPFVHDVGTGITHWLPDDVWLPLKDAEEIARFPIEVQPSSPGEPADEPWPAFERDKGKIKPTITNAVLALRHVGFCEARIAQDEFKDAVMVAWQDEAKWRPLRDTDYTRLRVVLERHGFKNPGRELVRDAAMQVSEENRFDSALQWAEGLVWDGVPRVEHFLERYAGAEAGDYSRAVSGYMWTALAARLVQPGAKCDMVPVLVGGQGTGKSTGVMAMSPEPDSYVEVNLEHRDDNLARSLRGKLVGELGELRGLMSKEAEAIKAWITRTHEEWIPKYMEFATKFPRRLVFIGTTNSDEFLADDTGERRWLPVRVGVVDADAIARDRDQLWAEAVVLFRQSGLHWREAMDLAVNKHDEFKVSDAWAGPIEAWLMADDMDGSEGQPRGLRPVKVDTVLTCALGIPPRDQGTRERKRAAAVLKAYGYVKRRATHAEGGKAIWEPAENCTLFSARYFA